MASRKAEKERLRQERMERERELAASARRRRLFQVVGGGTVAVIAAVVIVVLVVAGGSSGANNSSNGNTSHSSKPIVKTASLTGLKLKPAPPNGQTGPEGIPVPTSAPLLASNATSSKGGTVDGISCGGTEQTAFHVHTHLTIFVNGVQQRIPYGIGIVPPRQVQTSGGQPFVVSGSCFYWLHTHAYDGIIHIESPVVRTYTLGDFFDIWGQPLSPNQVGPAKGKVTAFYNGKKYVGNPRNIPIGDHIQIQLDVGTPLVAPQTVSFASTGL